MTASSGNARPNDSEAGFTLLELLIAMTLLGLLTIALYGGLRFGTQVWARSEASTSAADQVLAMQSLLRRELSRAYPEFLTGDPTDAHIDFDGTAETVAFLTPDPRQSGALLRLEIHALRTGDSMTLRIAGKPELAVAGTPVRILAEQGGFRSLTFAYYGSKNGKDAPAWQSTWQDSKHLPALIRVSARFVRRRHAVWPAFIVAPRIDADAGCTIDLLTKNCQGR